MKGRGRRCLGGRVRHPHAGADAQCDGDDDEHCRENAQHYRPHAHGLGGKPGLFRDVGKVGQLLGLELVAARELRELRDGLFYLVSCLGHGCLYFMRALSSPASSSSVMP